MAARDIIDGLLELTVVGSWSRLGYLVRRRLYHWADPAPDSLRGKTVLVTGPTSGLGLATAQAMAALGARVILIGRSKDRLDRLRDRLIEGHGADRFPTVVADMSSLQSVRAAVDRITETEPRLDVLVDNAGAIHETRTETADGLEATFATMVVGPFALIDGLLPLLEASDGGRVITVASGGMYAQRLPLDDLQYEHGDFNGPLAYARAKRASIALIREWSRRCRGNVRFDAMHPGWADTHGLAEQLPGFYGFMRPILRSPAEGVDTIVWLASDRDPRPGGLFYLDRRPRPFDRVRRTRLNAAQQRRLWDTVVNLSSNPSPDAPVA